MQIYGGRTLSFKKITDLILERRLLAVNLLQNAKKLDWKDLESSCEFLIKEYSLLLKKLEEIEK